MNEKLHEALNEISDKHLAESVRSPRRYGFWIGAVAAVLALVISLSLFPQWNDTQQGIVPTDYAPTQPSSTTSSYFSYLAAYPQYPELVRYPDENNFSGGSWEDYNAFYKEWRESQKAQYDQPDGYADSLASFFADSVRQILTNGQNTVYSPINVYMALAMLAESTDGNSRQQILDLLGADSIEALRTQADHLWNAHYCGDGRSDLILANSLWLDDAFGFQKETVDLLASNYFASTFRGDLGTEEMNEALRQWLNTNTGEILYDQIQDISLDPLTCFALSSTIFFSADWDSKFSADKNTVGAFHSYYSGDLEATFMNQSSSEITYYWGSNFGAVELALTGGHSMWLILPDEGVKVADVLESDEYLQMTMNPGQWKNRQYGCTVHLSLPKFDVASDRDLIADLQALGVTDVFNSAAANFSPLTDASNLAVSAFKHAARVAIDEDGVIGAAYTVIIAEGVCPPDGEVYFTLDRPFLFVVSSHDNLPIFTGTIMEP